MYPRQGLCNVVVGSLRQEATASLLVNRERHDADAISFLHQRLQTEQRNRFRTVIADPDTAGGHEFCQMQKRCKMKMGVF